MRLALALTALLIAACSVLASGPYTPGGDGYWYGVDGLRYTRTESRVWVDGYYYWRNGCRYWQAGYYKTSYAYALVPLTYKTPNWRDRLLTIAREKQEHEEFMQAIREMGLTVPGYASGPHLGAYGVSGNTIISQFKNVSATDLYGLDLALLFQQQAALARDGQAYGAKGVEQLGGLVDRAGERAAFAAEIVAKGQAAAQVLQAMSVTPSVHTRNQQVGPAAALPGPVSKRTLAMQACIKCHGEVEPKGNYRVSQHWTLTPAEQMEVVRDHLLAPEGSDEFMPKGGKRLPAELILEFVPQERKQP